MGTGTDKDPSEELSSIWFELRGGGHTSIMTDLTADKTPEDVLRRLFGGPQETSEAAKAQAKEWK